MATCTLLPLPAAVVATHELIFYRIPNRTAAHLGPMMPSRSSPAACCPTLRPSFLFSHLMLGCTPDPAAACWPRSRRRHTACPPAPSTGRAAAAPRHPICARPRPHARAHAGMHAHGHTRTAVGCASVMHSATGLAENRPRAESRMKSKYKPSHIRPPGPSTDRNTDRLSGVVHRLRGSILYF